MLGNLSRREFQLEHFNHSKPIIQRQFDLVPPLARQVVPDLFAPLAATPSVACFPKFARPTKRTKTLLVFKAFSQHVFFRRRFASNRIFIRLNAHSTILHQSKTVAITIFFDCYCILVKNFSLSFFLNPTCHTGFRSFRLCPVVFRRLINTMKTDGHIQKIAKTPQNTGKPIKKGLSGHPGKP